MAELMAAVQLDQFGGPEVLTFKADVPRPSPKKGEVLIRVRAVGVNPGDAGVRSGELKFMTGRRFPLTPGLDAAGEVVEGDDFAPGTRVLGFGLGAAKTYAQYVTLPSKAVAAMPDGLSFAQAAALPVAGLTALQCVDDHGAVKSGDRVLIRGAGGGVGHLAIQLARQRGAVVTALGRVDHAPWLEQLGAHEVLPPGALAQLNDFDVVLDLKGGLSWRTFARLTRSGARAVTTVPSLPNLAFGWAARVAGAPRVKAMIVSPNNVQLTTLAKQVAAGALQLHVDATFPLDAAADAHRRLAAGGTRGKLVLNVVHPGGQS